MMVEHGKMSAGIVDVQTTSNRGFSVEEVAERCLDRFISISDTAPEPIKQQARVYRDQIRQLLTTYMREAITSDRTTIGNTLTDAGHPELAELIRRL